MEMDIPIHILNAVQTNEPEIDEESKSLKPIASNTNSVPIHRPLIRRWASHDPNSSAEDLFHASDSEHDHGYQTDITSPQTSDSGDMQQEEVEDFRDREYPMLRGKIYLDHGGATQPCRSMIENLAHDLIHNLYGNPHSASTPSATAGHRIDAIRERTLRYFGANPDDWDLVFTANATASIKLVGDCFKDLAASTNTPIWYGYHKDAHTSLVGLREYTKLNRCFTSDEEVNTWINSGGFGGARSRQIGLFAYPGQSNFSGRRLPLNWPGRIRKQCHKATTYTLLDAAALASTAALDLSDAATAPDFVAMSMYKIFGLPDVGTLLVRKESAHVLQHRKYFGGGTVDMVIAIGDTWHAPKETTIHDRLEDGTLPFHQIFALDHAITAYERLYGPNPMKYISQHTAQLAKQLYEGLSSLRHSNGLPVCHIYKDDGVVYGDPTLTGATMAFNVRKSDGSTLGYTEIERAGDARNIFIRSGSLCNPGGMAGYLGWSSAEMRAAHAAGHRCSSPTEVIFGRSTGVVRVSIGAMNTASDIIAFLKFMVEVYVEGPPQLRQTTSLQSPPSFQSKHRSSDTRTSSTLTPIPSQKLPPLSIPFTSTGEGEHAPRARSPVTPLHADNTFTNEPQEKPQPRFIPEDYTKRYRPWEEEIRKGSYVNVSHEVKPRDTDDDTSATTRNGTPSVKARKFGRSVVSLLRSKSHAQDANVRPPIPSSPMPPGLGHKSSSIHPERGRKSMERTTFQRNVDSLGM